MINNPLEIGVFDPNATNDIAYNYIDEYGLCVVYSWNKGIGDCIGRTMDAYLIYNDPKLVQAIENLWQYREEFGGKMVGIRHPDVLTKDLEGKYVSGFWENRMSRDHYIYTLVALKLWENRNYPYKNGKLQEIVKATPFGIRRMARWTLSLVLWSKSLVGNNRALWWYLVLEWLQMNLIYRPILWIGNKICNWGEEMEQDEWEKIQYDPTKTNSQTLPKWKQRISKIILPAYAIGFSAHQLYVTSNRFPKLKKAVQNSLLKMVGKTNYVQQMMLGKKGIPRDKVEAFKTMSGGRWSGYLNIRNDRDMKVFPEGRFTVNLLDVDRVRYLYNETQLD